MAPVLRLFEDSLSGGASLRLPPLPRMIFVVHGAVTIDRKPLNDGEAGRQVVELLEAANRSLKKRGEIVYL